MSDFKGTPGPWQVATQNGARIWNGDSDIFVADCKKSGSIRLEEIKANAQLISAAPELLEALDELERYADGFSVSAVYLNEEIEGQRLLKNARAAIAKALGTTER